MQWSIFSRLMTGYVVLLALATAVSVYAITQLIYVRDVTQSVIMTDNPLLDLHKNLSDALLSEERYEKKYVIMHDPVLYEGFLKSGDAFERSLRDASALAETSELKRVLSRAAELHVVYRKLVQEEASYLGTGRQYAAARYHGEKERIVSELSDELMKVRSISQQSIVDKVKKLSAAGARATRAVMITTAAALAVGIILSIIITASITAPLAEMQRKMSEISNGIPDVALNITSPPEIAALGRSFTLMCGKLKELDKLKTDFYTLMSHELRTPLSSIKESTSLFLEGRGGAVTEKQKKLLTIIAEESNRMIDLVNSLLDISKLEAGMVAYSFTMAELNPLIVRAVTEMTPLAEAKGIRIENKLSEIPLLSLDAEKMLQVLRNLLGNALKFTPRNGLVVISSFPGEQKVCVSVTDTGPGIAPDQAAVIFEKYRQAEVAGQQKIQGTGLGLAIVKHIVQDHGGAVWVDSDHGRGSTFTFALPASLS